MAREIIHGPKTHKALQVTYNARGLKNSIGIIFSEKQIFNKIINDNFLHWKVFKKKILLYLHNLKI